MDNRNCCKGNTSDIPWTDHRPSAIWKTTIWTNASWEAAFPYRHILFDKAPGLSILNYVPDILRQANDTRVRSLGTSRPRRGTCFNNAVSAVDAVWADHGHATFGPMSAAGFNRVAREACSASGFASAPQLWYEHQQR